MKIRGQISLSIGLIMLLTFPLSAQDLAQKNATDYFFQQQEEWGLQIADLQDLMVTDQYISKHNGVTHIYFIQRFKGIEIYNAISGVHLKDGEKVVYSSNRFLDKIAERVQVSNNAITAAGALALTAADLKLPIPRVPQVLSRSTKAVTFMDKAVSRSPIPTKQVYLPKEDGSLQLCWNVFIEDPRNPSGWNMFIDAESGKVLKKSDETIYCTFDHPHDLECAPEKIAKQLEGPSPKLNLRGSDGASYNVFPGNIESPNHGNRMMLTNPADLVASPFGWHDTNGREGPEYTFTRGNNVHAYLDSDPDGLADGPEPDGGPNLIFDFPYTVGGNPTNNSQAAVTQLFYMNNYVHDFVYHFGFDEPSGNYQQNNYGNQGRQGDPILAEAQDGSGLNNANFMPSRDGTNGRMQMFLWSFGGNSNFTVISPSNLVGNYPFTTAAFGPQIIQPIEGELVNGISASADPNLGCTFLANAAAVNGKIVLLDRGDCFFEEKVVNADEAGAIACIICNNTGGLIQLGDVDTIPDPGIPSIMMTQGDCARFRQALQASSTISVKISPPDFLDSDFDNGIIAHEYGHGISTRLTGGPASAFCVSNNEAMGEGWSDFFALITSVQPDGNGALPRGIGTFVTGQATNGSGIRRQRYSTDENVNDQTYDDVIGTSGPHPNGEAWAVTLWDIYWTLADEYGFNPDPTDASAGNNIAIQLMMDGLKLQTCDPGYIDGRDAIIAADIINNDGANECMLWEVFARRGLGWSAIQGSSDTRNDNIGAFDTRPECIQELKIAKSSTPIIQPGEIFTVTLTVTNDKTSSVTDVMVNDVLPDGTQYVAGSANGVGGPQLQGEFLVFEIGNLPAGSSTTFTYQLESDPTRFSTEIFVDDVENGRSNWNTSDINGSDIWRISAANVNNGERAWFAPNTNRGNDQLLQLLPSIDLANATQPVLRFAHDYDIEPGLEGGLLEISPNGVTWGAVAEDAIFRQPFVGRVAQSTFGLAKQKAFWGDSEGFVESYVDFSQYQTSTVRFRFRYSTDEEQNANQSTTDGWYIDDIEMIDMVNYESQVCVTSSEGDIACAMPANRGTIVETALTTSVEEVSPDAVQVRVFPNPALDQINVALQGILKEKVSIQLLTLEGRLLAQEQVAAGILSESTSLDVSQLPKGMYFVKVQGGTVNKVEKIIVQ